MNERQPDYKECVAAGGKLIALYRQPPEAFAGLDADERKVLETARLLKTESKERTGKYREPSALQISRLLDGSYTPDKVQVMLRKINARGLLQIYKPDEKKEPTMQTAEPAVATSAPVQEAPAIYGRGQDAVNMFQPVFDAYMDMARTAAQLGDKVTYTYAVKQLADDTFTGMYFNARRKAVAA